MDKALCYKFGLSEISADRTAKYSSKGAGQDDENIKIY